MGNAQRAFASTFCEAPGCPEDAAPDALYCPRHAKATERPRADCAYFRCDSPVQAGSPFCEAHTLLEEARSQPAPALDPQTKEPAVPERTPCHIDGCENLSAPITIGARKQGGRYDLCDEHLDELNERTADTRRRNREARDRVDHALAGRVSPAPLVEEDAGAAGSPAGEGTETAPPRDPETLDYEFPLSLLCGRRADHGAHDWADEDSTVYRCNGSGEDEQQDEPDVEPQAQPLPPSPFDLDVEPDVDPQPERALTWVERAQALVDIGTEIDELERKLEAYRARWRALASDA